MCASGGGDVRRCATEPFTKAIIDAIPAEVPSLCIVAGLQRLFSSPANSELV